MNLDRRRLLSLLAGAAALKGAPRPLFAAPEPGLKEHAAARGMVFGTMVLHDQIAEPACREAVLREAGMIVPGNEMKWRPTTPQEGVNAFGPADSIVTFATENGLPLRGHTAVWHQNPPVWAMQRLSGEAGRKLILDHVRTVVGHFRGRVQQWDVVNEAINPRDGKNGLLRDWPPYNEGGYAFLADCYKAAHEADPNAKLYYNEYDLEYDGRDYELRREGVLRLISEMKERGAPLHGLGIQSHLTVGNDFSEGVFRRFLANVASFDLRIMLTEFDVSDRRIQGSAAYRDELVADAARAFLTVAFDQRAVDGLMTWGISDRDTWLTEARPRIDGGVQRALPLDVDYRRKPLWSVIAECFDKAPPRR